jgi:hypothetical protein
MYYDDVDVVVGLVVRAHRFVFFFARDGEWRCGSRVCACALTKDPVDRSKRLACTQRTRLDVEAAAKDAICHHGGVLLWVVCFGPRYGAKRALN